MTAIEDYALLGNLRTAALVSSTGSIDWMCLPRFDSPACFASLLDSPDAGYWRIFAVGRQGCTSRNYIDDTLVLETVWQTAEGTARVVDFMPRISSQHGYGTALVRIVEGIAGCVAMESRLRVRFDYGHLVPWVRHFPDYVEAIAGPDAVRLATPSDSFGEDWTTVSRFTVHQGERVPFVLTWSPSHEPAPERIDADSVLAQTLTFWREWSAQANPVRKEFHAAVIRSLIVLKALTYEPTGGIVAAVTTSLPERIGGNRNWDYRYCWLRDSTYTLNAMLAAGYVAEAQAWREWLLRAVAGDPADLQTMYSIDGARRLPELELPWLGGYEGSRPVRIGNAAAEQLQLDVWGETLDSLDLARGAGLCAEDDSWALQVALLDHLEGNWRQPDNGVWEVRGPQQHFTHSKVMAWVAADRMVHGVRDHGYPGPLVQWEQLRAEIHADVLARGFDSSRGSFVQAYGSRALDASTLLIPRVGFLPASDPRVLGTIAAIRADLTQDGFVKRYETSDTADGFTGGEGMFLACSFWLVDAMHGAGMNHQARSLFRKLIAVRNDVGLLSEEWDPMAARQLGNTPQAFSHFALVVSAYQLSSGHTQRSNEVPTPPGQAAATSP